MGAIWQQNCAAKAEKEIGFRAIFNLGVVLWMRMELIYKCTGWKIQIQWDLTGVDDITVFSASCIYLSTVCRRTLNYWFLSSGKSSRQKPSVRSKHLSKCASCLKLGASWLWSGVGNDSRYADTSKARGYRSSKFHCIQTKLMYIQKTHYQVL